MPGASERRRRLSTWKLPLADLTTKSSYTSSLALLAKRSFLDIEHFGALPFAEASHKPHSKSVGTEETAASHYDLPKSLSFNRALRMAEQSINIPQVIVFAVVAFLVYRWYSSKPSANARPAANRSARINPAQIDTIAQMFPQLNRRDIAWDLQRNGGNAAATTERVLSGRSLDSAPASFQLPAAPTAAPPTRPVTAAAARPSHPDLIARYNLSSKLTQTPEPTEEKPKVKAWSADRNERQSNLQRRREEMILAARRKMEEKEKASASGSAA